MAQAFGNTVQNSSPSTLSTALNNKINPSPLAPIKPANSASNAVGSDLSSIGSFLGGAFNSAKNAVGAAVGSALNGVGSYKPLAPVSYNYGGFSSGNTSQSPSQTPTTQSQTSTPASTPAIKSVTTTYHPPTQSAIPLQPKTQNAAVDNPISSTPSTPTASTPSPFFNNTVASLANTETSPYNQNSVLDQQALLNATAGNQQYQDKATQIGSTIGNELQDIQSKGTLGGNSMLSTGEASPVALGRGAVINQNTAALEQAALANGNFQLGANAQGLQGQSQQQTGYNNAAGLANTQQNYQQSAQSNAAGYAQPQSGVSFFGNPLTGGLVGGAQNGGQTGVTGNALIDGSVSKAIQAYQAGTPINDAMGLVQGGAVGQQAFLAQIGQLNGGSTPNVSAQNASANQNITQGVQTQGQAYNLSTSLKQLDAIKPLVLNFLQNSPLNQTDSPLYNQPINKYVATLGNTAAAQQFTAYMTDIAQQGQNIIANKGAGTPTSAVEQQAANDPSLLTPQQLQSVLSTWDTLGQTSLGVLQGQSQTSLGGNGGYSGGPANPQPTPVAQPNTSPGSGVTNPLAAGAAGIALDTEGLFTAALGSAAKLFGLAE